MASHHPYAVIIGMPGAGKTRVGKEAAAMLGREFADSDIRVEDKLGMKIPQYFNQSGEPSFRDIESSVIRDLLEQFDGILALGGGAPMTPGVQDALLSYVNHGGRVVYLQADPAEAMERAVRGGRRPMLSGDPHARWKSLFRQRDPVYRSLANLYVPTHGSSPRMAARKLAEMMEMRSVHVTGGNIEAYDVRIGENALNALAETLGERPAKVAVVHTESVQRHSDRARALIRQAGYDVSEIIIPDAEAAKTISVVEDVLNRLGDDGFTRSDALVAVGGGAATDLGGFVASTWMRGIRYVNCPTSLLAMVDASTGGKTGVNTKQGKNLVGTFYTPAGVLADLTTLATLPNDIFVEGLGEVAKSGFIADPDILRLLGGHAGELKAFDGGAFLDSALQPVVTGLVERTVKVKARYVSEDLTETGSREFLNYGHTLGHAIEALEHFRWRHGNAVAVGCVYAAELACLLGYLDREDVEYHRSLLDSLGLPISWNGGEWDEVLELMHRDKKARGRHLRFVILDGIGHPRHLEDPPLDALREAFDRIKN